MARLLAAGGLLEEEREALLHSAAWLAKALAVENRVQAPAALDDSLRPPGSVFWGPAAAAVKEYVGSASCPSRAISEAIQSLLEGFHS